MLHAHSASTRPRARAAGRRRRGAGQRGLSLIEVALAVTIVAIMGSLTWGSLSRSFDAYETVTEVDQRYHNIRVAMDRMCRELAAAFLTADDRHHNRQRGRKWKTIFKAEEQGSYATLHFVAFAHQILLQDAKESDQCELSYYVDDDPDKSGVKNLMRREAYLIDDKPEKGGRADILAENIQNFKLRFWNLRTKEWVDEWDTEKPEFKGRLPTVIELTLVIQDEDGKELSFVTKTRTVLSRELGTI